MLPFDKAVQHLFYLFLCLDYISSPTDPLHLIFPLSAPFLCHQDKLFSKQIASIPKARYICFWFFLPHDWVPVAFVVLQFYTKTTHYLSQVCEQKVIIPTYYSTASTSTCITDTTGESLYSLSVCDTRRDFRAYLSFLSAITLPCTAFFVSPTSSFPLHSETRKNLYFSNRIHSSYVKTLFLKFLSLTCLVFHPCVIHHLHCLHNPHCV